MYGEIVHFAVEGELHRYRAPRVLSYIYEFNLLDACSIMFMLLTCIASRT